MENQDLTVRQLLAMLAERIEQTASADRFGTIADVFCDGVWINTNAELLDDTQESLNGAVASINQAISCLDAYHRRLAEPDDQDYYDD